PLPFGADRAAVPVGPSVRARAAGGRRAAPQGLRHRAVPARERRVKIARIETFLVPPRWLFVRVEADEGAVGWGEASLEGHAEAVDGAFAALRDRFVGHDPFRIEDMWQVAYRGGFYRGGPVLMSALSGLDPALWQVRGRELNLPAWQMMGGKVRDRIRASACLGGDRPH